MSENGLSADRKIESLRREMRATLDRDKLAKLHNRIKDEVVKLPDDPRKRAGNVASRDITRRRLQLLRS
jgi:hypothetical protein